jgi:hypothetical protein
MLVIFERTSVLIIRQQEECKQLPIPARHLAQMVEPALRRDNRFALNYMIRCVDVMEESTPMGVMHSGLE